MKIDMFSFCLGWVALQVLSYVGSLIHKFCDRMIAYYQRKLDERESE